MTSPSTIPPATSPATIRAFSAAGVWSHVPHPLPPPADEFLDIRLQRAGYTRLTQFGPESGLSLELWEGRHRTWLACSRRSRSSSSPWRTCRHCWRSSPTCCR